MPEPTIGPGAPPPHPPPVPCVNVIAPPPPVSDDPLEAMKQAATWREDVIRQEAVIQQLRKELAAK